MGLPWSHCTGESVRAWFLSVRIHTLFGFGEGTGSPPMQGAIMESIALEGDEQLNKIKVHRLARGVIDQYGIEGRLTAISDEELETKIEQLPPERWQKYEGS